MNPLFLAIVGVCLIILSQIIFVLNRSNILELYIYRIATEKDNEPEEKEDDDFAF